MKSLQSQLAGDERMVLIADPARVAKKLSGLPYLAKEIKLVKGKPRSKRVPLREGWTAQWE